MGKTIKVVVNILIFLIVISFIAYIIRSANTEEQTLIQDPSKQSFKSDYEQRLSIDVKDSVIAFELLNQRIFAASNKSVAVYNLKGNLISSFNIKPNVRDIEISNHSIFLLYPSLIEKYSIKGDSLSSWEACSDLSDYCAFTITNDFVFVTDVGNKNICKYTTEGNFVQFIQSPGNFITPSHFFDITHKNDTIYCANPGRHIIESYTFNGEFIAAFGSPGAEAGSFAGCCNPSYISFDDQGYIITSEKGNPRISRFNTTGKFNKILLNNQLLGGGHLPYSFKAVNNNIFVAAKNQINIYQLKKQ